MTAVIKNKNGKEKTVHVSYIIGADGARSVVRHLLNIPLAGATYHQLLYVLDCTVTSSSLQESEVFLSLSDQTFHAFFPLAQGIWRIIGVVPEALQTKDQITFEDIQKHFADRVRFPVTLSNPNWISMYHSHHRCAKHFQMGRAFLVGDAAHIHSPVGAQGMNTGLQDAYNLAWKIAYVLQKKANPSLLATYTQERLPFAQKLVATTDRVFSLIVSHNIFRAIFIQHIFPAFLQIAVRTPKIKAFIFKTVSQIAVSYHESVLSHHASVGIFPNHAPKPGERVPYIFYKDEIGKQTNIQEKVDGKHFIIVQFGQKNEEIDALVTRYKESILCLSIPYAVEAKELYEAFGIEKDGYYLIRPDMYVAFRGTEKSTTQLQHYLETFLCT